MLLFSTKMYLLLTILFTKMFICHIFFYKMENFLVLSRLLILVLIKLVYREEILGCEIQPAVVLVVLILIKAIFQCGCGQILIYQKLHAKLDGM